MKRRRRPREPLAHESDAVAGAMRDRFGYRAVATSGKTAVANFRLTPEATALSVRLLAAQLEDASLDVVARLKAVPHLEPLFRFETALLRALAERGEMELFQDAWRRSLEWGKHWNPENVVSEALANAAKHAKASVAEVHVEVRNGILDLTIDDDGVGGADPARGSGLVGLVDRVEALGGAIAIESPGGAGTSVHVELPMKPTNPASSSQQE